MEEKEKNVYRGFFGRADIYNRRKVFAKMTGGGRGKWVVRLFRGVSPLRYMRVREGGNEGGKRGKVGFSRHSRRCFRVWWG